MGGGIQPEQVEALAKAIQDHPKEGAWKEEVKWVKVPSDKALVQGVPTPENSANLTRIELKEQGL